MTETISRPRAGDELTLSVESLAHGGAGVARLDGYVVFVRGGFPGDRVRVRVSKAKRAYAEGRAVELLTPSPERIAERAPHPGAPWQVLRYERQLEIKRSQVEDALRRLGGFEQPPVEAIVPAVAQWRYRNKVEYSFGSQHEPGGARLVLGFHQPGRWNDIHDVADDVLASERVGELRRRALEWCRAEGLTAYDRRSHHGFLRNLVVREGRHTGQLQVRIVTSQGDFDAAAFAAALEGAGGVLWTRAAGVAETTRDGPTDLVAGSATLDEELHVAGERLAFRISPQAFFQTNTEMAERLYEIVLSRAALSGRERVHDLFCGIGTISLTLATRAGEVFGVELVEAAVADAAAAARRNGLDNAHFVAGDVRTALRPLVEGSGPPDVTVVDPPRAGLSAKVVRRLLETRPARIVYVSCNPTTLAPNARQMADAGYRLRAVTPVDMFPQTPHVEAVALLER